MILINFGSKLNKEHFIQIKSMSGLDVTEQVVLPIDPASPIPLEEELGQLYRKGKLTADELSGDLLVQLPSNPYQAAVVLAELHRRAGKFPWILRTRPHIFGMRMNSDVMAVIDLEKITEIKAFEDHP